MFSFQMTIKLKEAEDAIVTLLHSLPRAHPFRASLSIAAKAKPTTAARLLQSSATTHTASLWLQDGQLLDLLLRGNPTLAHADGDKPVEWLSDIGWADMQRLVVISDVFAELPTLLKVRMSVPCRLLGVTDAQRLQSTTECRRTRQHGASGGSLRRPRLRRSLRAL